MVVKVGINGFGRIGRVIFRTCQQHPDLEVAAINDPAIDVEYICYLMKFDSTHGKYKGKITHTHGEITVDDAIIKIFHEKLPANVPWQSADVQYVVEASGIFTSLQKASGHLANESVKRVIVTAPSVDVPMVILGVNQGDLHADKRVISSASSTLYCLAPIVKILNDNFGVSEGFITSIHAMTPSLKPLDGLCLRGKHWRDHRSIHQNIIPATTGACKALGKIIPQVKDKLVGLAFRVPIVNVSVLDITMRLNKETSIQEIAKSVEALSKTTMHNIVKISTEEAVSSDFADDQHSCILDVDSSLQLKKNFFKLVCWYENEYSYACRVIDLILFSERQFQLPDPRTKMTFVRTKVSKKLVQQISVQDDALNNICQCQPSKIAQVLQSQSQLRLIRQRSPTRPVILRNSGSRNETKSNEIFRVWNDESEIKRHVIQNRKTIHHSDVELKSQSQISNLRAQLRLENVKKEFSKMVSITEDLLKKCSAARGINCTDTVLEEKNKVIEPSNAAFSIAQYRVDKTADCSSPSQKNSNDISGDFVSSLVEMVISKTNLSTDLLSSFNENSSKNNFSRDHICNDNSFDFKISKNKSGSSDTTNTKTPSNQLAQQCSVSDTQNNSNASKIEVDETFQEQVVKTINHLIDGLSQSLQSNVSSSKPQEECNDFPQEIKEIEDTPYLKEIDSDSGFMSPAKRNQSQVMLPCNENTLTITSQVDSPIALPNVTNIETNKIINDETNAETINKTHLETNNESNAETSDETNNVKVKGNEIVEYKVEKTSVERFLARAADIKQEANCLEEQKAEGCITELPGESPSSKIIIQPEIFNLNNIMFTDPIVMLAENSKCASSTLTASDNSATGRKMDLYDKLDSVSASDSDNSFQIHERKSQVINLADLSSSIEDLARLDKICRIIEISDELSDKLFSALSNNDNDAIKKAKWSFKDLCQRIKLDEFCNKLFASQNE